MKHTRFEKRIRNGGNVSYTEYSLSNTSNRRDVFQAMSIQDFFSKHHDFKDSIDVHVHNFHLILWISKGNGIHYIDCDKYEVNSSTIFFLSPNNSHHYQITEDINGYIIAFSTDFFAHLDPTIVERLRYELFHNNGGTLCFVPPSIQHQLETIVKHMISELQLDNSESMIMSYLASLLTMFIAKSKRKCVWPKMNDTHLRTQSFITYSTFMESVDKNFTHFHNVREYATLMNISLSLLSKCTKEHGKCTPLDIISKRIMVEAKQLLCYTPYSLKEIAGMLGFKDSSYFNKYFKRYVGILPSEFRNLKQPIR